MSKKSARKAEVVRQLAASTKTLAAIAGHKPVEKSVDTAFEELTDVLRRCRHLESRGICSDNSLVSCKLPNGIDVALMPKPLRAADESTTSLWSEYEEVKRRATDRQQQADDPLRGSGRTTACILRTFAAALEKPNKWVQFHDHAPRSGSFESLQATALECRDVAELLCLKLDVGIFRDHVAVRSPLEKIRAERSDAAKRFREAFGEDPPGDVEITETEIGPMFSFIREAPQLPTAAQIVDYGSGELSLGPSCSSAATEAVSPVSLGSLSDATGKAP